MFLNYLPSEMVEVVGLTMIFSFLVGTILILLFTSDQANTKRNEIKRLKNLNFLIGTDQKERN